MDSAGNIVSMRFHATSWVFYFNICQQSYHEPILFFILRVMIPLEFSYQTFLIPSICVYFKHDFPDPPKLLRR